jgi:integrase/recombinase XerD
MDTLRKLFRDYIESELQLSRSTVEGYERDVAQFLGFLKKNGFQYLNTCKPSDFSNYLRYLEQSGASPSSIQRKFSSLRKFNDFLYTKRYVSESFVNALEPAKAAKRVPEALSAREIALLLKTPDTKTPKGLRDRTILEMICATGMKASELISLDVSDVLIENSVVKCGSGVGKRVVPLTASSRKYVKKYALSVRGELVTDKKERAFFVNMSGERLTRQGICKIIRAYAEESGLKEKVTPGSLRYAFAQSLVDKGVKIDSIQTILGHADKSTTINYLQTGRLALNAE